MKNFRRASLFLVGTLVALEGIAQFDPQQTEEEVESASDRLLRLRAEAGYPIGNSRLQVRGGQISVSFAPLPVSGSAFESMVRARPGQVVPWKGSFATKLTTEVDLDFGGSVLQAENQRRGFPGAYTLWLKRTAGG